MGGLVPTLPSLQHSSSCDTDTSQSLPWGGHGDRAQPLPGPGEQSPPGDMSTSPRTVTHHPQTPTAAGAPAPLIQLLSSPPVSFWGAQPLSITAALQRVAAGGRHRSSARPRLAPCLSFPSSTARPGRGESLAAPGSSTGSRAVLGPCLLLHSPAGSGTTAIVPASSGKSRSPVPTALSGTRAPNPVPGATRTLSHQPAPALLGGTACPRVGTRTPER